MLRVTPALFSSYAVGATNRAGDAWVDADLVEGTHLRVVPHTAVGLPLTPLILWKVGVRQLTQVSLWAAGGTVAGTRVTPSRPGGPVRLLIGTSARDAVIVGVEARPVGGTVARIALIEPATGRVASSRSSAPWRVGGPVVNSVDVWASGAFDLVVFAISQDELTFPDQRQSTLLGIPGLDARWYRAQPTTAQAMEKSIDRVRRCAPLRPTIAQLPAGAFTPFGATAADQEEQRLREFESRLVDWLKQTVNAVRREDPVKVPASAAEPLHLASFVPMRALLVQALDPGVARYLGLMTMQPSGPAELAQDHAWACSGLFAFDVGRLPKSALLTNMQEHAARADEFARRFSGADVQLRDAQTHGLLPRVLTTAAMVVPPPDTPPAPAVKLAWSRWIRAKTGVSTAFQQGFEVQQAPLAPLVAIARRNGAQWEPRNGLAVEVTGRFQRTLILGARRAQDGQPPPSDPSVGMLQDMNVPASGAPWLYQVALGDVFGRFGSPAQVNVPAPIRPPVPTPSVRALPVYSTAIAPGAAPASPGKAVIELHLTSSGQQPAGAHPLKSLRVTVQNAGDGTPRDFALDPTGMEPFKQQLVLPLKATAPSPPNARTFKVTVNATATDAAGRSSSTKVEFDVSDPRPPALPVTATGLIWSTRPGPAEDVELALTMPAPAGSRWRVYLTDANTVLGDAATGTRAAVADAGAKANNAKAKSRDSFRLLTREPVEASSNGTLTFSTLLPRALESVQFMRLVPLTGEGVEGDFEKSPLVPVAVPSDRRPPAPRIELSKDAAGLVQVNLIAEGLAALLQDTEQGLFTNPVAAGARAPQFRLRRAVEAVAEPIYARELPISAGKRDLRWSPERKRFEASFVDPDAKSYGRYFYWAEVRLPAERRVKPGVAESAPPGCVRGDVPTQMQDMPGLYSEASAALMVCPLPPNIPTLKPANVACTYRGNGNGWQLTVAVTNGPKTPPKPVGLFQVRVYVKTTTAPDWKPLPQTGNLADGSATLAYNETTAVPNDAFISVELIDPVGRVAAPLVVRGQRLP